MKLHTYFFFTVLFLLSQPHGLLATTSTKTEETTYTPKNPDLKNLYEFFLTTENLTTIIHDLGQGVHMFGSGSKFNLKDPAAHFSKALLNICGLGKGSIKLLDKDFDTLKQYYSCVVLPDEELRSEAALTEEDGPLTCKPIHCINKQTCMGVTLGKTAELLAPFLHNLLGKVVDLDETDPDVPNYTVQSGLLTNFNQLTTDAISLAQATNLPSKMIGKKADEFLTKMKQKLKKLEEVQKILAIVSNDVLTILSNIAPLLGGKEYLDSLPELSEEEKTKLLAEQITLDPDVLDELDFNDFID